VSLYVERDLGTIVIDRSFRGVGRIKRATGTNKESQAKRYDDMLSDLYDLDRLDVLKAIKANVVSIREVWAAWKYGDRKRLPTIESMKDLVATSTDWIQHTRCSDEHRKNHRKAFTAILKGEPEGSTLADLPTLLKAYKRRAGGEVMFNRVRASILSFLRQELGKRHRLYEECADVPTHTERPETGVKLSVNELRQVVTGLQHLGGMAWALVLSGMRRGEYWGKWDVTPDRYRIFGTKTRASVREVPNLGPLIKPSVQYQAFRVALGKVRPGMTPHDFRHTYMHWMEQAGISRIRRRMYLGHSSGDVSAIYERHEVEGFLKSDADLMRVFIGEIPTGLRLVG
jgi:integrase